MHKIIATAAALALLQATAPSLTYAQATATKPPVLLPAAARDTPYPDVPKDHWAYQAVEAVRQAGIMVGYPASTPQMPPQRRKTKSAKTRG